MDFTKQISYRPNGLLLPQCANMEQISQGLLKGFFLKLCNIMRADKGTKVTSLKLPEKSRFDKIGNFSPFCAQFNLTKLSRVLTLVDASC